MKFKCLNVGPSPTNEQYLVKLIQPFALLIGSELFEYEFAKLLPTLDQFISQFFNTTKYFP